MEINAVEKHIIMRNIRKAIWLIVNEIKNIKTEFLLVVVRITYCSCNISMFPLNGRFDEELNDRRRKSIFVVGRWLLSLFHKKTIV